jgi:hypothetical protein
MSEILTNTIAFNSLAATGGRFDAEKRERIFVASDETPVLRRSWWDDYMLIVSHDPKAVDLSRVGEEGSCMFLENHNSYSTTSRIGKIISATVANKQLEVTVRINSLAPGNNYLQEVQDKCEPGKSIQFEPYETELISEARYEKGKLVELPVYKLTKWGLLEVSTVSIPAIGGVGFSREQKPLQGAELQAFRKQHLNLFGKHLPKRKLSDLLR